MNPVETMRREIERAGRGVRQALRAKLKSLLLNTQIQRIGGTGLAGEQLDDMELFQHFGFTSAPPAGTEYIVLPLGGRTSASVIVGTEKGAVRFVLDNQGETCVYNEWGDFAHFKKDRSIHVKAKEKVFVETKVFRVEATTRIELVTPEMLVQASTSARFETPVVQATQLLQPQQLTIGQVPGGVGAAVATMNGGTVNFNNVAFNYQACTLTFTGGSLTHNGRHIDASHTHPGDSGGTTGVPN